MSKTCCEPISSISNYDFGCGSEIEHLRLVLCARRIKCSSTEYVYGLTYQLIQQVSEIKLNMLMEWRHFFLFCLLNFSSWKYFCRCDMIMRDIFHILINENPHISSYYDYTEKISSSFFHHNQFGICNSEKF